MTPHKCPCCNGTGLRNIPRCVAGDQPEYTSTSCGPWPCNPCGGTGIVWEQDEIPIVEQGEEKGATL